MMKIFLKGYYGYQNIGDELLLLGAINWITQKHTFKQLVIEAENPTRLRVWISKHAHLLDLPLERISCVDKQFLSRSSSFKIFGGGEVVTDARRFPYNGWSFLLGYLGDILSGNYALMGGIGKEKNIGTGLLYRILLGNAQYIVTREDHSTQIAQKYSSNVLPYHDFSEDIFAKLPIPASTDRDKLLINCNPYLSDSGIIQKIVDFAQKHNDLQPYFMPGDIKEDSRYFSVLKQKIPHLQLYDWTEYTLEEIVEFVASCGQGIAARLHILLLLRAADVPVTPLAYQEKITKFFGDELAE